MLKNLTSFLLTMRFVDLKMLELCLVMQDLSYVVIEWSDVISFFTALTTIYFLNG